MSVVVEDTAPQWVFSSNGSDVTSMSATGWTQLANDTGVSTAGYSDGTALWTATPGARATLVFQGTSVLLYAKTSPTGGRMTVMIDYNSTTIDLWAPDSPAIGPVFTSPTLDAGTQHALAVIYLDDGGVQGAGVNIDKVGVEPAPASAFPPTRPVPVPPSFPNKAATTLPATLPQIVTMTATETATFTVSSSSSQTGDSEGVGRGVGDSLSSGAVAGIAVGCLAGVLVVGVLIYAIMRQCFSRRRRSTGGREAPSRNTGYRNLFLGQGARYSLGSYHEPGFVKIRDQEKAAEQDAVEYAFSSGNGRYSDLGADDEKDTGRSRLGLLPEVRHASTLSSITIPRFADPQKIEELSMPVCASPPPSAGANADNMFSNTTIHSNVSNANTVHTRNGSVAVSIRVDTNVASVGRLWNRNRSGSLKRRGCKYGRASRQVHRRAVSEFTGISGSGFGSGSGSEGYATTSAVRAQVVEQEKKVASVETHEDKDESMNRSEDDCEYYAEYSGYGSRSSRAYTFSPKKTGSGSGSLESVEEGDGRQADLDAEMREGDGEYEGEDDDCTTPLLLESPALPSSHASALSHFGGPAFAGVGKRGSHLSRKSTKSMKSTALRSPRTGSRTSLRYSMAVGKKASVRSLAASVVGAISTSRSASSQASPQPRTPGAPKTPTSAGAMSSSTGTSASHSQGYAMGDSPLRSRTPSVFRFPAVPGQAARKRGSGDTAGSAAMVFPPPSPISGPVAQRADTAPASTPSTQTVFLRANDNSSAAAAHITVLPPPPPAPSQTASARMRRTHRPAFGPRAKGASSSSISSFSSSGSGGGFGSFSGGDGSATASASDGIYRIPTLRLGTGLGDLDSDGGLSVVEESLASRTASGRVSMEDPPSAPAEVGEDVGRRAD